MQQTENLKLNLIEPTDAVDPAPINENFRAVERELSALTALAADVGSGGKNCRIAWGSYVGDWGSGASHPNTLTFDFVPVLLVCYIGTSGGEFHMIRPATTVGGTSHSTMVVTWGDNSVSWYSSDSNGAQYNRGTTYYWLALGVGALDEEDTEETEQAEE